jgi:hypothetical protein
MIYNVMIYIITNTMNLTIIVIYIFTMIYIRFVIKYSYNDLTNL